MKKFLGLIFSLLSAINLNSQTLEWYKNSTLTKQQEFVELQKDSGNVAILEYLLLKHKKELKDLSINIDYNFLANTRLEVKMSTLSSFKLSAPTAPTANKKPANTASTISRPGLQKYINFITTGASNDLIRSNLLQNSSQDLKNASIVEYLLRTKFSLIYKNLITRDLKNKQDLLNASLASDTISAGAGGVAAPLTPAEATSKQTSALVSALPTGAEGTLSADLAELLSAKVITQEEAKLLNTNQKDVAKFARLSKMGQPAEQLRLRMQSEGLVTATSLKTADKPTTSPVVTTSELSSSSLSGSIVPTRAQPAFLSGLSSAKLKPVASAGSVAANKPNAPKKALSMLDQLRAKQAEKGILVTSEEPTHAPAPKPVTSAITPSSIPTPVLDVPKTKPASPPSVPTSISPTLKPIDLMDQIKAGKAGKTGGASSHPVTTSATVAAGGPREPVDEPASADPIQKYRDMIRRRASDGEILQALMAPKTITLARDLFSNKEIIDLDPQTKQTLEEIIPVDSKQDINNMDIVDYLLKTKYSQPQATLDKMFPYFKIHDLKRHLISGQTKSFKGQLFMEIPTNKALFGENPKSKVRNRNTEFSRDWIEFPSPNLDEPEIMRHIDYHKADNNVFLLDSNKWSPSANDYYPYIWRYNNVNNYYWSPDGKVFTLVYDDGTVQSYEWIQGNPINERIKLPEEEVIVIDADEPEEDSSEPDAASAEPISAPAKTEKKLSVAQPGETEAHFRARLLAKLNAQGGKYALARNPNAALANAVLNLDKTFRDLSDKDIGNLFEFDEYLNEAALRKIINEDPSNTSLLEKAKVYIAIHTGVLKEGDLNVDKWATALDEIALQSAGVEDLGGKATIKFVAGISTNNDNLVQTLSKFADLDETQRDILKKPNKYLRSIGKLLKKAPNGDSSVTNLDRAKIYLTLLSHWIDLDAPENVGHLDNIKKWETFFGLNS